MKLSKLQEKEVMQVYNAYWDNYLQGDVETMQQLLDDDYTQVGSAEGEVFLNKKDAVQFLYDTIDQVAGKLEMRNRSTTMEQQGELILIHERCDLYALADDGWIFYSKFRASTLLKENKQGWKITHQHSSFPDGRAEDGENIAINKIAAENLQLRDAVKRRTIELEQKNRDLEIESALERVRAQAMSMRTPDDLPGICEVLFSALHTLGFDETRNAMINIHDDEKTTFVNYDYSDEIGKSINHLSYNIHPVIEKQIKQIRSSGDAFSETSFTGKDLDDWKAFRKKIGEKDDPRIENTDALYYYFYSIGTGSIGISTFHSITEEKKNVLKRFRNVFDFAYRRYMDVALAEEQAREAQIELALERVRARTMAMQHSEELTEASFLLDSQVRSLGIKTRGCGFNIYGEKESTEWFSSELGAMPAYKTPRENFFLTYYEAGQRGETLLIDEYAGEECVALYDYLCSLPVTGEGLRQFKASGGFFPTQQIVHVAYFKYGYLLFITLEPIPEAHLIFLRFAKVFEQTYTRFLDLQKAEAQAKEAKIETALERTRTQSMIMQHSKELDDTLRVFHEQVLLLGINSAFSFLWLPDEEKDRHIFWAAWAEKNSTIFKSKAINYPLDRNEPATAQCLCDWKSKEPVYSYAVPPEGVENYFAAWKELIEGVEKLTPEYFAGGLYYVEAFMKYGCFGVMVATDLREYEKNILGRFAVEFERTYTRFLDLQKAEAQAREAQIELGLERVRAGAMAMQKSHELSELVDTVFKELTKLDFALTWCIINIIDEPSLSNTVWAANPDINKAPESYHMLFEDYPFHHAMMKGWKERKTKSVYTLEGNEKRIYDDYLFAETEFKRTPEAAQAASRAMEKYVVSFSFSNFGGLQTVGDAPLSDANLDILSRFGKVFDLTYTRFNDLKQAEAQTKEAQIEAALEKVRSRTMGMQKSEELKEVIKLVYQQLTHLKIKLDHAGFVVNYTPKGDWHFWIADELDIPSTITHPYFESVWANQFNEAKEKAADFFATDLNFEEKNRFYNELLSYVPGLPQASKDFYLNCPGLAASTVLFNNVSLYIENFSGTPYTDEENTTLKRFGKVFQQTYTRFLDLQKAEAQAREATIEASLERVRSKTIAMHNSLDVGDTVAVMFDELVKLGVEKTVRCGIIIIEDGKQMEVWNASTDANEKVVLIIGRLDMTIHPALVGVYNAWEKKLPEVSYEFIGEDLKDYFRAINDAPEYPFQIDLESLPSRSFLSDFFFAEGGIFAFTHESIPSESSQIFKRFAGVFGQTYRRYLDLQKAEAQAREAQIETALERVRSRTLAMQKSDELAETAAVLFQQLIALGIEPNRLYIAIVKDVQGHSEFWITEEDGTKVSTAFSADLNKNASFIKMFEGWKQQQKSLVIDMQGEELQKYFRHLTSLGVPFKGGLEQIRRVQDIAYFSKGFIGIASPDEQPAETLLLLERFAAVFNLTFTRFNDLKIAEAHALQAEQDLIAIKEARQKAEDALTELKATQKQLIQSEKMASLGELTAGIAHEIQNPLNFVNNFSEVSSELIAEMNDELAKGDLEEAKAIANDILQNLEKINHHGKRADAIVKGMLQHSQSSIGVKEPTDINKLADEYLHLAYHGLRAKDKSFNATLLTDYDEAIGTINIIPQDIGRVILNLINNAFYAVSEKKKLLGEKYEPVVTVSTSLNSFAGGRGAEIRVADNGNGISQKVLDKIFQPFFTTKPTGQGTGLGLSLAYDIVKAHGGELKVDTKEGEGSTFIIQLPNQSA